MIISHILVIIFHCSLQYTTSPKSNIEEIYLFTLVHLFAKLSILFGTTSSGFAWYIEFVSIHLNCCFFCPLNKLFSVTDSYVIFNRLQTFILFFFAWFFGGGHLGQTCFLCCRRNKKHFFFSLCDILNKLAICGLSYEETVMISENYICTCEQT